MTDADKKRRESLILLFLLLTEDTCDTLTTQVTTYLTGQSSIHSLSRAFAGALFGAHVQATYYGRRLAGVIAPMGEHDQQFAQTVMAGQAGYITKLLNDLTNSRYPMDADGNLPGDLAARLMLYARRLRATAQEAWLLGLPPDTLVYWRMSANEDHCATCPERELNGPYKASELQWVPGDGNSECGNNCLCYLETADGERCFPRN